MGYTFLTTDWLVWQPSIDAGNLMLGQVRSLEQLMGKSSGVSNVENDWVTIDQNLLFAFLEACANRIDIRQNVPIFHLARGPLVHLMALLIRITSVEVVASLNFPVEWLETANNLARCNMKQVPRPNRSAPG